MNLDKLLLLQEELRGWKTPRLICVFPSTERKVC
jgi:hypothetical protein